MSENAINGRETSPLALLASQRSHLLFVLSHATENQEGKFLDWYRGVYRQAVSHVAGVLRAQLYEQDQVDITVGEFARLPFKYLSLCELSLDGAHRATSVIEGIMTLHRDQAAAQNPATWLYHPMSEKVGRSPLALPSMLTLAFANGIPGQEPEFREWYATRHIRHALNIPALVSGQCFERAQFQMPGAMDATFSLIAMYEQEGASQEIIESVASLPESTFHFPTLDLSRFAESAYRPL